MSDVLKPSEPGWWFLMPTSGWDWLRPSVLPLMSVQKERRTIDGRTVWTYPGEVRVADTRAQLRGVTYPPAGVRLRDVTYPAAGVRLGEIRGLGVRVVIQERLASGALLWSVEDSMDPLGQQRHSMDPLRQQGPEDRDALLATLLTIFGAAANRPALGAPSEQSDPDTETGEHTWDPTALEIDLEANVTERERTERAATKALMLEALASNRVTPEAEREILASWGFVQSPSTREP